METEVLPLTDSSPNITILANEIETEKGEIIETNEVFPPSLTQSSLPDKYHEAYKMKLAGVPVNQIAEKMKIDRVTVWRYCREVEREFADTLSKSPQFNILSLEIKRLINLEELNLKSAENCKSERARAMFYSNAGKIIQIRTELLLETGIFDRAPEKLFKAVVNVNQELTEERTPDKRSREELIGSIIDKLSKSINL